MGPACNSGNGCTRMSSAISVASLRDACIGDSSCTSYSCEVNTADASQCDRYMLADSCPNKDTENAWTLYEMSTSSSSSSSTTTTSCSWSGHNNMASASYAAGVDENF